MTGRAAGVPRAALMRLRVANSWAKEASQGEEGSIIWQRLAEPRHRINNKRDRE